MAVAALLLDGDKTKLQDYMTAAAKQSAEQRVAADASGLSDNIGVKTGFDPPWYIDNCQDHVIDQLFMIYTVKSQKSEALTVSDVLRTAVEDDGRRNYQRELDKYVMSERAAVTKFSKALKDNPFLRCPYTFRVIVHDPKHRDGHGHSFATHIIIEKAMNKT